MRNRICLLLVSLLGFAVGSRLDGLFELSQPALELDFGQGCERAALSPDARQVAGLLRWQDRWYVGVTDLMGGPGIEPVEVPDPPARVQTFAWHSSSRWVAFGCQDQVRVFDTKNQSCQILKANANVRQVLFRGDILLGRADENVYLWNVRSGKQTFHLRVPHLLHADLSKNGKTLALGCFGEGVRLVAVPSRKVLRHLAPSHVPVSPTFCRNDRWLAVALRTGAPDEDHARLYEVSSGNPLGRVMAQPAMRGITVSPDGERLLIRSDNLVSVWEPSSGKQIGRRQEQSLLIDALSDTGKWVASTEPGGGVTVWSPEQKDLAHRLPHPSQPTQIAFSPNDRLEVAGDRYRLWWIR